MSGIIQPNDGTRTYGIPAKVRETKRAGTRTGSFLDMAAQARQEKFDKLELGGGARGVAGSKAQAVSSNETLEDFKKEIWAEIDAMSWGASVSVQITDDAFKKMMVGKDFKNKMMNLIIEDACGSNTMCGGTLIRIDGNGYSGYSYMDNYAAFGKSAVETHSKGKAAFYSKKIDKRRQDDRQLQRKRDMERVAAAAADRRDARERIAKKEALERPFPSITDLLKTRATAPSVITPDTPLQAGADVPLFDLINVKE